MTDAIYPLITWLSMNLEINLSLLNRYEDIAKSIDKYTQHVVLNEATITGKMSERTIIFRWWLNLE